MFVYRIVKSKKRTTDLSGTGAYNEGGRWNNEGVFALYTSENEALAMLEVLVHAEQSELPSDLYIIKIEIASSAPLLEISDNQLPKDWRIPENIKLKEMGERIMMEKKYAGIKVLSAIMPESYNYILNPLYRGFHDLIKVAAVYPLQVDKRFKRGN
ncbi:MAG: RES family NAD+ phosphorylase [Sediminibacterium sp.]